MDIEQKNWKDFFKTDPTGAWNLFLQRYNKLILAVIDKLVHDYDDKMELYAFTLDHLKNNDCQKLTAYFEKSRNYHFETWIVVIVRNCCMDWFRKRKGRKRLQKCINELSEIERLIFRYLYYYGYSCEEVYQLLKTKHGYEKSINDMVMAKEKIDFLILRKLKWNYYQDIHFFFITLPEEKIDIQHQKHPYQATTSDLEKNIFHEDTIQILNEVLQSLSTESQLLIRLYYYKELTLERIAGVLKMKNLWQVQRKLKKALKELKAKLKEKGIGPADFDIF